MTDEMGQSDQVLETVLAHYGATMETLRIIEAPATAEKAPHDVRIIFLGESERLHDLAESELQPSDLVRVQALLLLEEAIREPRRRFLRRVGTVSVWRTPSVRRAWKQLRAARTVSDLVRVLAQDSKLSDEDLLEAAIYPAGPSEPIPREVYESFAATVLEEVWALYESLIAGDLGRGAFEVAEQAHRKRGIELREVKGIEQKWLDHVDRMWPRVLRLILREASALEAGCPTPLRSIAQRAKGLLEKVDIEMPSAAQDVGSSVQVSKLLEEAATVLRREATENDSWMLESAANFDAILSRGSDQDRCSALVDLAYELPPRDNLLAALLREADIAPSVLLNAAVRGLYRRIRKFLIPAEKRMFCLMYMNRFWRPGQPGPTWPFNGYSFLELPFIDGILEDEELIALAVLSIGFKLKQFDDTDLGQQLHDVFRKHVTFYQWWVRIVREDDKERKRQSRRSGSEFSNHSEPDSDRFEVAHGPGDASPHETGETVARQLSKHFEEIIRRAEASGALKRHRIARMYFVERRTEGQIADRLGIRQQGVSKALGVFVAKDLAPQTQLSEMETKSFLRKAGFLRRGRRPRNR